MKKIIVVLSVITVCLLGLVYRVYSLNKDVPRAYYEEQVGYGENINLEQCQLKINSYSLNINENEDSIAIKVNMSIENKSEEALDIKSLLEYNTLSIGMTGNDYCELNNYTEEYSALEKDKLIDLDMTYYFYGIALDKIKNLDEIKLFISKQLYENEIKKEFENKKLYIKYVLLGRWDSEK